VMPRKVKSYYKLVKRVLYNYVVAQLLGNLCVHVKYVGSN